MATKATIIIPTEHPEADTVVSQVRERFSKAFGGATAITDARGDWIDENMDRVTDDVAIVFTTAERMDRSFVRSEAEYVEAVLDEDSVMYQFEQVDVHFT